MNASTYNTLSFDCEEDKENATQALQTDGKNIGVIATYLSICVCGLVGNSLVMYVILRFAKMKTVTNMYILNLAISDFLFLISLPLVTTTSWLKYWIFGDAMCKISFILFSITIFTSVFTLTTLSIDRYLAVCHPLSSQKYRQPPKALIVILFIWTVSFLVMLPIILYSKTKPQDNSGGRMSCLVDWPNDQLIPPDKAFTWYTFLLGFAIPVSLISVFYSLVILRLKNLGPANRKKSVERRKCNRKVTRLVLAVIFVYLICWLPHWVFQINLTFQIHNSPAPWAILMYNIFTCLTYANSMLNPFLYAFLSDNFRKSFKEAFRCRKSHEINQALTAENSLRQNRYKEKRRHIDTEEVVELNSIRRQSSPNPDHTSHMTKAHVITENGTTSVILKSGSYADDKPIADTAKLTNEDVLIQYADKEIQT